MKQNSDDALLIDLHRDTARGMKWSSDRLVSGILAGWAKYLTRFEPAGCWHNVGQDDTAQDAVV